jgi:NAD(P)-dependent dehydrogenase (short-subunit alcohol dehydrogenase family)
MAKNKIVLITGASAGIGLATATLLMNSGAKVYAASRRGGDKQKAASGEGEIINISLDVNDETSLKQTVEQIVKENGRLDVVISNAGNGIAGAIEDISSEEVKYQFETNFFGAVKTIQACLPVFRNQGYGKIITVSSVAGVIPIPFQTLYSASKSALLTFMRALSLEVKPFGIQCCTVLPGDTKTSFTSARKFAEKAQNPSSAYYKKMTTSISRMEKDEQNGRPAEFVAKKMVAQVYKKNMCFTVIPGLEYKIFNWLFKVLPTRTSVWIVGMLYA